MVSGSSNHKESREELIYLDDVAADGSIRRTYFKNIDQIGKVFQTTDRTPDLMTSKSEKEEDLTKRLWSDHDDRNLYQTPDERKNFQEVAVYLNDSHPDIKEALRAQEEEEEQANVLRIDFEELFQSTNSAKHAEHHDSQGRNMISRGIQTEDDCIPAICSMCIRCGERTDVKIRLDFGDTPIKPKTLTSISKKPVNVVASGKVVKPGFHQLTAKVSHCKDKERFETDVNRRLLFRNKPITSPQQPKIQSTTFTAQKQVSSPSKLNQRTYLKHFESRKNLTENSDMKYFSRGLRKMSHHSLMAKQSSVEKGLNKSSSLANIMSSQKKVTHGRSLGRSRVEEPTLDLPVEISLDSLLMERSLEDHYKSKAKTFEKMPQWPMEVDIDLGDISLVTDQTYVRKRDPRSHNMVKDNVRRPFLKSNWKTTAIN